MGDDTKLMRQEQASTPVSANVSEDVEIQPLSGKPFFHVTICKSHVCVPYLLTIASEITRLLPHKNVPVTLTRGKRRWEMNYIGTNATHKRFDMPSWRVFAADNSLKVGDVCLFELMTCTDTDFEFKVQVIRGDFPLLDTKNGSIYAYMCIIR